MDDKVIVALAGFGGAIMGSIATISGQCLKQWLEDRAKASADRPRKALLLEMLSAGRDWRKLDTLRHVIGADEETAKRLLLEIDAEKGTPKRRHHRFSWPSCLRPLRH